jgi:DNA-binding GntR family transcriptional regulator
MAFRDMERNKVIAEILGLLSNGTIETGKLVTEKRISELVGRPNERQLVREAIALLWERHYLDQYPRKGVVFRPSPRPLFKKPHSSFDYST